MPVPCPFCGVGCKLKEDGKPLGPVCGKGLEAFEYYKNVLERPLLREGDLFVEVSLEEAAERAAEWIRQSKAPFFAGSAEDTNESAWALQKLARFLGTNAVDHCGRVCHSSSVEAYKLIFGKPVTPFKMSDKLEEVLVVGSDVSVTYPVFWGKIKREAKRVVVVDAWKSFTMLQADEGLLVPPGPGFLAFSEVIYSITYGKDVPRWTEDWVDVREVKEIWNSFERPSLVHGMGVTQSGYGYQATARLILATLKRGGTVATLRGKVNVQGAGDMGLNPYPPAPREALEEAWGFPVPAERGPDLVEAFKEPRDFYLVHCQNVVASLPNSFAVGEALENAKVIHVTPKFTETSVFADMIVPSSPVIFTTGTVTSGDGLVTAVRTSTNRAYEFFRLVAEYLGLYLPKDVKEVTEEAFSLVDHYKKIDVKRLYAGEDQYVEKPEGWREVDPPEAKLLDYHLKEGYWFYTARDPALWTTKGGTKMMKRHAMKEAFYFGEDPGCEAVEVCSEETGRCVEGEVRVSERVPKGMVLAFFNHLGLKVNAVIPWEPREPTGTPVYKAAKVKVRCLR